MRRFRQFPIALTASFLAIAVLAQGSASAAKSGINRDAQALARHLRATPPASKANADEIARLRQRMIAAIELVEKSHRGNGPAPESLIENALDFCEGMGDYERLLTMNAVLTTWRTANGRGLFTENGKFYERITRGRGVGDRCVFELIVPAKDFPAASNQLANVRLVTEEQKRRRKDEGPDHRQAAHRSQLEKMIAEKAGRKQLAAIENGPKTNSLGETAEEALAAWEKEREAAGELAGKLPNIRLAGRVTGTPSHMTRNRWRATAELTNLSNFPTEVTLDIYFLGITDRKKDHYLMAKSSQSVKLRRGEERSLELYTRAESSYKGKADDHDQVPKKERKHTQVRARGFVMVVRQGDEVVAFTGSDRLLANYADPKVEYSPLRSLPAF